MQTVETISRPEQRLFALRDVRDETPDMKSFFFEPLDDRPLFTFRPGHFINISFADNKGLGRRSFSIASSPREGILRITVKRVRTFTSTLFETSPGEPFEILAPLGLPYVRDEEEDAEYVLIAGGSGIVPFRSLLHYAQETDLPQHFHLFTSCKRKKDACFHDELVALSERSANMSLVATLTQESRKGFEHGRIDTHMLTAHLSSLEKKRFIVCGPPRMVRAIIMLLRDLEVPMARIKTETWGN